MIQRKIKDLEIGQTATYEGCYKSDASYFIMLVHDVSAGCCRM